QYPKNATADCSPLHHITALSSALYFNLSVANGILNHQVNHSPPFHFRGHRRVPILEVIDANTGNSSDCRTRFARGNSGDRTRSVLQLLRMAKHVFMVAL